MKPLILILLAAVCAQAQTIADAARRERARQAQARTNKIYTSEDIKGIGTKGATLPVENPAPGAAAAAEGVVAATNPAATPTPTTTVDPFEQWTQETTKLRTQVRELLDQETAIQLEINNATAQINAPVTTQSLKDQAARVQLAAQEKLITVRAELTRIRAELAEKDLAGPPARRPQPN